MSGPKSCRDDAALVVGNVFRADLGQASDAWIRKYTDEGAVVWTETYNNPIANDNDLYFGVDVDADGRIAVAGYTRRADVAQGENLLLTVYDADGGVDWTLT